MSDRAVIYRLEKPLKREGIGIRIDLTMTVNNSHYVEEAIRFAVNDLQDNPLVSSLKVTVFNA